MATQAAMPLSRPLEQVQGGDLGDGFVYLSTSNQNNTLYRVELATGTVTELGSAGHAGGEGEGSTSPGSRPAASTPSRSTTTRCRCSSPTSGCPPRAGTGRAEQWILAITVATTLVATIAIVVLTRRRWRKRVDH